MGKVHLGSCQGRRLGFLPVCRRGKQESVLDAGELMSRNFQLDVLCLGGIVLSSPAHGFYRDTTSVAMGKDGMNVLSGGGYDGRLYSA